MQPHLFLPHAHLFTLTIAHTSPTHFILSSVNACLPSRTRNPLVPPLAGTQDEPPPLPFSAHHWITKCDTHIPRYPFLSTKAVTNGTRYSNSMSLYTPYPTATCVRSFIYDIHHICDRLYFCRQPDIRINISYVIIPGAHYIPSLSMHFGWIIK